MKKNDNYTVMVFGFNYIPALDVVRSVGEAGFTVNLALCSNQEKTYRIAAASRYLNRSIRIPRTVGEEGEIGRLLDFAKETSGKEKQILFPLDDRSVYMLDKYMDLLEEQFIIPRREGFGKNDFISLMDKHRQNEIAESVGMNVPWEWLVRAQKEMSVPEDICFPCYCKALISVPYSKKDQRRCDSRDELLEYLKRIYEQSGETDIVVQEFLDIDEEYVIIGASLPDRVLIPGVTVKVETTRYVKGLTMMGALTETEKVDGFSETAGRIALMMEKTGYIGPFDMEFIRAGGRLYFNEWNLRVSGPEHGVKKAGVNLPGAFVDAYVNGQFDREVYGRPAYGRIFLKEKEAITDFEQGCRSWGNLMSLYRRADDTFLWDPKDKKPAVLFYRYTIRHCAAAKVKKLFRRQDKAK